MPSIETALGSRRAKPRNQRAYVAAAPINPSQIRPATFIALGAGRGGSRNSAIGSRIKPPAVNCQAVKLSAETGGCHFLLRTVPAAIDAAPPNPAAMPIQSSCASGPISSKDTPITPVAAAPKCTKSDWGSQPSPRHQNHDHSLQRS